jgi:UDP-N-acetylmuramate dehydrogenase
MELGPRTTWGVGGRARLGVELADLSTLPDLADELGEPRWAVLGAGSNVLVQDEPIDTPVVVVGRPAPGTIGLEEGTSVVADAGWPMPRVARFAAKHGRAGLEFLSGIPGTLGGGVRMNAGTGGPDGPCLADVLEWAVVLDGSGVASTIPAAELELGYRSSSVGRHGWIVLRCSLRTAPGRTDLLRQAMVDHLASRRARQPLSERTAGSVFLPAAGRPAGEIIDRLDLVGARRGRAVVSRKHANWIEAGEGCTAAEIEELIAHVQEQAWLRGGVRLEREVQRFPAESTIVDLSARVRASDGPRR